MTRYTTSTLCAAPANLKCVPDGNYEDYDDVLAAAAAGKEWALTVLYRDTQPALVRYLRAQAPGEEEDLATEVWIAVARGLNGFVGGQDGFRRFVFTIARRRAVDAARRRGRRRTDPVSLQTLSGLAGGDDTESEALDQADGDDAVRRIVALLSPEQAEVVLLRVVAGFTVTEVAEIIGRRPAAVSIMQHRALRRLARSLEAGEGGKSSGRKES